MLTAVPLVLILILGLAAFAAGAVESERLAQTLHAALHEGDAPASHTVQREMDRIRRLLMLSGLGMLAAAAGFAVVGAAVIRSIRESLKDVVGLAGAVAAAEARSERIRVERKPEGFGELGDAIEHMNESLDRLIVSAGLIPVPALAVEHPGYAGAREAANEQRLGAGIVDAAAAAAAAVRRTQGAGDN